MLGYENDLDALVPAKTNHGERGEGWQQVEQGRTHEGMAGGFRLDRQEGTVA